MFRGYVVPPWYDRPRQGSGGARYRDRRPEHSRSDEWWDRALEYGVLMHRNLMLTNTGMRPQDVEEMSVQERVFHVSKILEREDFELKKYNNLVETMVKLWSKGSGQK